jgi:hypothetical protein
MTEPEPSARWATDPEQSALREALLRLSPTKEQERRLRDGTPAERLAWLEETLWRGYREGLLPPQPSGEPPLGETSSG